MKSIVSALYAIVKSIENLTKAIQNKNSNSYYSKPLPPSTTTTTYVSNQYSYIRITVQEEQAMKAIYSALTDKGNHPEHHDYIVRELELKWPVLHKALSEFIAARNQNINNINRQKHAKDFLAQTKSKYDYNHKDYNHKH